MRIWIAASLALLLASPLFLAAGGARAQSSPSTVESQRVWHAQDACAKKAFKQYPDYTPESNAKRAQAKRLCLATGNLPPRDEQPIAVPPADNAPAR
jgi:hypothetical protein